MNFVQQIKQNWQPVLLFFFSLLISLIWFRDGKFIASGESSLLLFNAERSLEVASSMWSPIGTGLFTPTYLPRTPFLFIVLMMQKIFSPQTTQMIVYFLLILLGTTGIYFLSKLLIKDKYSKALPIVSALFYFLNLFTMTQVWSRLLYTGIFAWSYLPWFLYFWIRILNEKSLKWIVLFLISSLVFSNTFSTATFILTLWLPAIIWLLIVIITSLRTSQKNITVTLKIISLSILTFVLWVIVNFWWIYPFVSLGPSTFLENSNSTYNYDVLTSVTRFWPLKDLIILYHNLYLGEKGIWGNWYQTPTALVSAYLIFVIMIFGAIKSKGQKYFPFLISIFLIGFFIIKGLNPPLGRAFYYFLFKNIPSLGILRNPYEKFGIVFVLAYSFFYSYGLEKLLISFYSVKRYFLYGFTLVLSCGLLVWPIWSGNVYRDNVRFLVPGYYKDLNSFLENNISDGRILVVPLISGDSAKYNWGYQGIEASDFLYKRVAIGRMTHDAISDIKLKKLYDTFGNSKNYNDHLKDLNIEYIVFQKDIDVVATNTDTIDKTKKILNDNPSLKFVQDFGELSLYSFKDYKLNSLFEIRPENSAILTYQQIGRFHYKVFVKESNSPFELIFKTTYHPKWIAKNDNLIIGEHKIFNDFANSWNIDKKDDFIVDIIFKVWPWE